MKLLDILSEIQVTRPPKFKAGQYAYDAISGEKITIEYQTYSQIKQTNIYTVSNDITGERYRLQEKNISKQNPLTNHVDI